MTEVVFQDHSKVELIDHMGDDDKIAFMARGSLGNGKGTPESNVRLIRSLMTEGHKVPFEHCVMTFRIETPILVSRQLAKHRHSSISELSGRYTELPSKFYVPGESRPLGQEGKRMDYEMVHLDRSKESEIRAFIRDSARSSSVDYEIMLANGVSREVARMVLPVNTFTELRMTVNLLSLMNILHLRMDWSERGLDWTDTKPVKPGHPQFEIQEVADEMGHLMAEKFPATFQAFADNGFII